MEKIIGFIFQVLSPVGAFAALFYVVYQDTRNILLSTLAGLGGLVIAYILQVVVKIIRYGEDDFIKSRARAFQEDIARRTSKYFRHYQTYLKNSFHNMDLGGIGRQNDYNIELEAAFVELTISTQAPNNVQTTPIPKEFLESSHTIWHFFNQPTLRRLVILGYPGSGKTTLLKHTAMALIGKKWWQVIKTGALLPVFIELRRHAAYILENPSCSLADFIAQSNTSDGVKPPPDWFKQYLQKGRCVVMLDGLDEVKTSDERKKIIEWFDRIVAHPDNSKNRYIITARPGGYKYNTSKQINVTLEVQAFSQAQQKQFIEKWYLADEINRDIVKPDDENKTKRERNKRVQDKAKEIAQKLLREIQASEDLGDLAQNPLLITMMTIVYRQRGVLSKERATLYADVCQIFLGRRWQAREIELSLRADQAQLVLQPLAYHMMQHGKLELTEAEILPIIEIALKTVTTVHEANRAFLEYFELSTGVLVEREKGVFKFAHKTFQEFLAAVHIKENRLEATLIGHLRRDPEGDWWPETARLYAAQSDASTLIEALIEKPLSIRLLALAIDCGQIVKQITDVNVRNALSGLMDEVIQKHDHKAWKTVAGALLHRRLKETIFLRDGIRLVQQPITWSDYQFFVDETSTGSQAMLHHFNNTHLGYGTANTPITGLTPWQAKAFCDWLTRREADWSYRLPTLQEDSRQVLKISAREPLSQIGIWLKVTSYYFMLIKLVRNHAFDRDIALDLDLARALGHGLSLDHTLARTRTRMLDHARARALNLTRARARALDLARDLDLALDHALDHALNEDLALTLDLDPARARDLAFDLALELDLARDLARTLVRARSLNNVILKVFLNGYEKVDKSTISLIVLVHELNHVLLLNLKFYQLHQRGQEITPQQQLQNFIADLRKLNLSPSLPKMVKSEYQEAYDIWVKHLTAMRGILNGLEEVEKAWASGAGTPEQLVLVKQRKGTTPPT